MNSIHWPAHLSRRALACAGVLAALLCAAPAHAEIEYSITDLGTLGPTFTSSGAASVNVHGQAAGLLETSGGPPYSHAFLYDGAMHDLGSLGGDNTQSAASSINAAGHVTGFSQPSPSSQAHAFFYDGTLHDLGTLGTDTTSYGNGINDSDHITGYSTTFAGASTAFLYDGTMHSLGTLGGPNSSGYGINSLGQVTGEADTGTDAHAFIWTPAVPNGNTGSMIDIDGLPGRVTIGRAINDQGWVAGTIFGFSGSSAFFYDGTLHDIGTLGTGATTTDVGGINHDGVVVGTSGYAFRYSTDTGMVDLNTLIDPASGWVLFGAGGINDAGQIVGVGSINDEGHAFLLTPLPEPSTLALGLAGLLALGSAGARSRFHGRT